MAKKKTARTKTAKTKSAAPQKATAAKKTATKKKAANASGPFTAFPQGTLQFLVQLRANNSKTWFDAHRPDYDSFYVAPAKAFVEAVAPHLKKISTGLIAEPKVNGSIFRINRDTRFSKDKRPYKDHLDFTFWEGNKKETPSYLFFRISPDGIYVGTGFHQGSSELLKKFRTAVSSDSGGKSLAKLAQKLRGQGHELGGEHYKRPPRDFDSDGPAAEFLLHNGLYCVYEGDPACAAQADIMDLCLSKWKAFAPLHKWLMTNMS